MGKSARNFSVVQICIAGWLLLVNGFYYFQFARRIFSLLGFIWKRTP